MTRQQVAKRLGKSLATVRRLEGGRLHAVADARGVHHFDPDEVEALARDIDRGDVVLWQELGTSGGDPPRDELCPNCQVLEGQLRSLRRNLGEQAQTHQREQSELRAAHAHDARELADEVEKLLAALER
jgi:hypothetical protein